MTPRMSPRQAGQSTTEYLGIVVVLALLMGAAIAIIGHQAPESSPFRSGERSPFTGLADLLGDGASDRTSATSVGGSGAGWLRRTGRDAGGLISGLLSGQIAVHVGFGAALVDDAKNVLGGSPSLNPADPLRAITGVVANPVRSTRLSIGRIRTYVRELRQMPVRDAYARMMYDTGRMAEWVLARRVRAELLGWVLRHR